MKLPLANKLKRRLHIQMAALQDEVAAIIYAMEANAILHGGTAIWRCYDGNRFSEDLDFYIHPDSGFEEGFRNKIKERGLLLMKFKKTENAIFSKITDGFAEVRFEAIIRKTGARAAARSYEKTDGSFLDVLTLSAENLVSEKIAAYSDRRFIRDYYDIYHLLRYVKEMRRVSSEISAFLEKAAAPIDERKDRKSVV